MQYTMQRPQAISDQATGVIRSMIIDGDIADGGRINEVQLSKKLGISRTPVREALGQLIAEQFVTLIPRRGFFALELTAREFSDLYDLRPILDPAALLLGGLPSSDEIDQIERANEVFLGAEPGLASVNADETFHKRLLTRCPNAVLMGLIENLMYRTKRYELALFRETKPIISAGDQHAQIIKALRDKNLDLAAARLKDNLTGGKASILSWLQSRTDNSDGKNS
jgi:DNA-binding GntR family transcriptional regulator